MHVRSTWSIRLQQTSRTSYRASFRSFSTRKHAKYFTCCASIFWVVAVSHAVIWLNVNKGLCAPTGDYATFYGVYVVMY
ncbi:unnamed protein product [Adineta ricciae]|uniref:Uncharacterized protein n=1 Tax=Adineta ricciae TaxID=249248 RepID=A0A814TB38_ADIRI|nr:unnamed protein product [Adineta ricciae]